MDYLDVKREENFVTTPGHNIEWENMNIVITSVSQPPIPLLSKKFLTDGNRTILVSASNFGKLIPDTIGDFQCVTRYK